MQSVSLKENVHSVWDGLFQQAIQQILYRFVCVRRQYCTKLHMLEDSTVQSYTEVAECFLQCCQYHRAQHIMNMHMLCLYPRCYRKRSVVRN
jgi:hypothetical protein